MATSERREGGRGGKEGRRDGWKEGGRGGKEGWKEGGREGGEEDENTQNCTIASEDVVEVVQPVDINGGLVPVR